MRRLGWFAIVVAVAALLGCSESEQSADQVALDWDAALADRAELIARLPADTRVYLRIPTLWNVLSAPKDTDLAPALASDANQRALASMQQSLGQRLEDELGPLGATVALLLRDLRSPLELAVLGEADNPMTAKFVLSGRFAFDSTAEFEAALEAIAAQFPMANLASKASADTPGHFLVGPASLFYGFDDARGRLLAVAGLQVTAAELEAVSQWQDNPSHAAVIAEQRVDADRQGFFNWADGAWLQFAMAQGMQGAEAEQMRALGLMSLTEIVMGYGVSNGRGHLAMEVAGAEGRVWDLTLPALPALDAPVAGDPRWAFSFRLPPMDWWVDMATFDVGGIDRADVEASLAEADQAIQQEVGLDVATISALLAGRYTFVNDLNGAYLIHDGIDTQQWQRAIRVVAERYELDYHQRDIDGVAIHHLAIPGVGDDMRNGMDTLLAGVDPSARMLLSMASQINTHLYWVQEADRVVMAQVPQVLLDRAGYPGEQSLSAWFGMAGEQSDSAWLRAGAMTLDTTRSNYYNYLTTMQAFNDVLGFEFDIARFPTARELAFSPRGKVGVALEFAEQRAAMRFSFDHHPGDMISGQGAIFGVAAVGILAAIAVPAYQDYTVRAAVAERYYSVSDYKLRISEFVASQGRLPGLADGKSLGLPGQVGAPVYFDAKAGELIVSLEGVEQLHAEARLILAASLNEAGMVEWSCSGLAIGEAQLPSECRQ
jgi:hypothetical protein